MPPIAAAAIPAVIGAGASAGGSKKGNKQANQQFQLQQQMAQFGQGLATQGMSAWTPAADYFKKLLSGDPTSIAEATGPARDVIQGQSAANSREMAARMPAGGEAVAAQGANALQSSNNIARLYAGVQPGAAQSLGQLSSIPISGGASFAGIGRPDTGGAFLANQNQSNAKGGLGQGVGTLFARHKQGKQNGGSTSGGSSNSGPILGDSGSVMV